MGAEQITPRPSDITVSREKYADKLYGFWLGQCIANWTGLLGFMIGKEEIEKAFNRKFTDRYHIHRTRQNFKESPGVLQPISLMVSEPLLIFLVSGFLIGLTLLATGILYIRSGVSSVQTEK